MLLSRESIETLNDLIENRLSIMTVGDQDDLRERIKLQRALAELHKANGGHEDMLPSLVAIPRRGRRRKVAGTVSV